MSKLAVIGARTSSQDGERDSIESQLAECRAWAEANGYTVIEETREDGVSGAQSIDKRPQLQRGLDMLINGRVQAYIWRSPDRFSRRGDAGQIIENHRNFADGIRFARVPYIENRFASVMARSAFSGYAEGERHMIYERTSNGRNRAAREGTSIGVGTLPKWLRFHYHARTKNGAIAAACVDCRLPEGFRLVESEAARVREIILGGYAAIKDSESPWDLVRLREETSVGGLRVLQPLRPDSVEAEWRSYQREQRRRDRAEKVKQVMDCATLEKAETTAQRLGFIVQRVPAPVTWEQFYEARQKALARPNPTRGRPPRKRLPLQGRIICSVHGKMFTPRASNGKSGYVFAACTCTIGHMAKRHGGKCEIPRLAWTHTPRGGRTIVELVREALEKALETPEAIDTAARSYLASYQQRLDQAEAGTGNLEAALDKERRKYTHLKVMSADPDTNQEVIARDIAASKRRIDDLRAKLADLNAADLTRLRRAYRTVNALLEDTRDLGSPWVPIESDAELDRIAGRLDLRIYVEADRLRIEGALPVADVALAKAALISPTGKLRGSGASRTGLPRGKRQLISR